MDSKRIFDNEYKERLNQLLEYKYTRQGTTFDLILVSDNNALNFLVDHRNDLFGEIPVVFCGVNYFREEMLKGEKLFTGFGETPLVFKETLELALKINPDLKHVYSYSSKTQSFQVVLLRLFHIIRNTISLK